MWTCVDCANGTMVFVEENPAETLKEAKRNFSEALYWKEKVVESEKTCKQLRVSRDDRAVEVEELSKRIKNLRNEKDRLQCVSKDKQNLIERLERRIQKLEAENADKEIKIQRLEEQLLDAHHETGWVDLGHKNYQDKLQEENASLKLEVEKLKGLIVEARKYVATANLMLA